MTNSIHSPKNKFRGVIYQAGISGSSDCFSLTFNDLNTLRSRLGEAANGKYVHIIISENKKEYPLFDWVEIESYDINKK